MQFFIQKTENWYRRVVYLEARYLNRNFIIEGDGMQMRTGGVYKNPNPIAHGVHTFPFFPRFPTLVELIVGGSVRGRARTWERSIGRDIKAGP